ncbi:M48 family metallopeptidase [Luteimonas sp. 50]|uniref:M48 family metallopeptidase n=1 Tax=Cognatiluteimonas sedimenti TaxID=2927791 RepID=A0ABT0A5W4_9GAMM|nr:SprT family zinc-dependent metalloprotease [Lysobacter sedimenti]MCJ0826383.1 M48 family metallopeptidase [Lysobacter sedimenti]
MPSPFRLLAPRPRTIQRDAVELALADGRCVQVARVRDPRARRLKLSVDERGARLTLPVRASLAAGERFLAEHRDWLAAQLAHCASDAQQPLRRGETATLPLRGACLPLRWEAGRYARLQCDGGTLAFAAPAGASDAALQRALRDFYASQARIDLGRWLPRQLPSLPRPPRRVQFKVMSSQWGSLAPDGSVALDLSLVLARPSAFEYVLVHELCHLVRADHSRAFWREVEARFPAWRDERDYFHAEGRRLKATLRALLG